MKNDTESYCDAHLRTALVVEGGGVRAVVADTRHGDKHSGPLLGGTTSHRLSYG